MDVTTVVPNHRVNGPKDINNVFWAIGHTISAFITTTTKAPSQHWTDINEGWGTGQGRETRHVSSPGMFLFFASFFFCTKWFVININLYRTTGNVYDYQHQHHSDTNTRPPHHNDDKWLDCPRSGPGPVWPVFADPGPGPQVQVQQTLDLDTRPPEYCSVMIIKKKFVISIQLKKL